MRKDYNKPLLQILLDSISIDEADYSFLDSSNPLNAQNDIQRLKVIYHDEYGNWSGLTQETCASWLQGLPTACTIPFMNYDIYKIGYKIGYLSDSSSDSKHYEWVDSYWHRMGYLLYKQLEKA